MRLLIQRVKKATLTVDNVPVGSIGQGMVVLVGIGKQDNEKDIEEMARKVLTLRIFNDQNNKMNLSLLQAGGKLIVVSQFTLYGDCSDGCRPDFTQAAEASIALPLYEKFVAKLKEKVPDLVSGSFGSYMVVEIHNDGPVTVYLQSRRERISPNL